MESPPCVVCSVIALLVYNDFMDKVCIGTPFNYPSAGSKARKDAIRIVRELNDYKVVDLSCPGDKIHLFNFYFILEFVNLFKFLSIRNSIIFAQEPLSMWAMEFLFKFRKINKNKFILLSHDFDSARYAKRKINQEVKILNNADCVISANSHFSQLLRNNGVTVPIVESGIFDYIIPNYNNSLKERKNNLVVSFVGNLDKSEFLREWTEKEHSYSIELNIPA